MEQTKKLSLQELKEKAGKLFIDANAIKGGVELSDCHFKFPPPPKPVCDNI